MIKLIHRARALLSILEEAEMAKYLVDAGFSSEDVFLAIKAAVILEERWEE